MKVAIPRMGETVAPCFEYCATMAIFTIEDGRITDQVDFPLRSKEPLDEKCVDVDVAAEDAATSLAAC